MTLVNCLKLAGGFCVFLILELAIFLFGLDKVGSISLARPRRRLSILKSTGFVFGKKYGRYLVKKEKDDGHILVIGGSGSGKTSCIGIPTLRAWQDRVFAIDIKGELYQKTAAYRPTVKLFNPKLKNGCGYNPYYLLNLSDNPAQDAREIAYALIQKPLVTDDPIWIDGARNFFTAAILHYRDLGFSFIETAEIIQLTPAMQMFQTLVESPNINAQKSVIGYLGLETKTIAGMYIELANQLIMFTTDQDIQEMFSQRDTIKPTDLDNGFDIYLGIPEDKLDQWSGILTLISNQFLRYFMRRPDRQGVPVLFHFEEAAQVGKLESIKGLNTLRSKNITIALFAQSLAQFDLIYGTAQRKVITDNCNYTAILNATDADTQEYFSKRVGTCELPQQSRHTSYQAESTTIQSTGINEAMKEQRIIKPESFATLTDIVLLTPHGYCRVNKKPYY